MHSYSPSREGIATTFHARPRSTKRPMLIDTGVAKSVTVIEPSIRNRLDIGTDGVFSHVHVDCVADAVQAVREHAPTAVLLSPGVLRSASTFAVRELLAACPGAAPIAVVDGSKADDSLLRLGACGVRKLVDLSDRSGWDRLRRVAEGGGSEITRVILTIVLPHLEGATTESQGFFGTLIRIAPMMRTVKELAAYLDICPSTLMSRFFRERLPAPKQYLAMMRLVHASALFEYPRASIPAVALRLRFSSPQSFGRHVRSMLGLTAGQFRKEIPLPTAIAHFASQLILPYQETFKSFAPLGLIACTVASRTTPDSADDRTTGVA